MVRLIFTAKSIEHYFVKHASAEPLVKDLVVPQDFNGIEYRIALCEDAVSYTHLTLPTKA